MTKEELKKLGDQCAWGWQTRLAHHMSVYRSTVCGWANGKPIPKIKEKRILEFFEGAKK